MNISIKIILYFIYSTSILCQENLILNPSLETWKDGKAIGWEVISNSGDIYKSNYRMFPPCPPFNDLTFKYRFFFPKRGHDGLSYFGNKYNGIMQGTLSKPLEAGKWYELSFWVFRPPIFSELVSNKLSIKFTNKSTDRDTGIVAGRWGRGTLYRCITDYNIVYNVDSGDFKLSTWSQAKLIFRAHGNELYLLIGFFYDLLTEHGLNYSSLYYIYDDFYLNELKLNTDTIKIFYKHNEFQLSNDQLKILQSVNQKNTSIDSITISSFANDLGTSLYNQLLTDKRNQSVKMEISKLIKNDLIKTISNGERFAINKKHKLNRRSDIIIHYISNRKENKKPNFIDFDSSLIKKLITLENSDQYIRHIYDSIFNSNVNDTIALNDIEEKMRKLDSINLNEITKIIEDKGYPGLSLVGPDYMNVAFKILQHSPIRIRESYFNIILKASNECEIDRSLIPMMIDRNNIDKGEKQIYGTQLMWNYQSNKYELFPVNDPKNLNKLRSQYCLNTIEKYLEYFNSKVSK